MQLESGFLYVYTGQITFTNLSSQDVTPSEKEEAQDGYSQGEKSPQDPEGPSAPPPIAVVVELCSAKSVYCLANKVRLAPLRVMRSPIAPSRRSA